MQKGDRAPRFQDRDDAGRQLAEALHGWVSEGTLVLGLPRGGVVVAARVCSLLGLPLDVFLVRKLGVPGHEEFAMGALASGGVRLLHEATVRQCRVSPEALETVTATETRELRRREELYRPGRRPLDVRGQTVLVIDDGLATGATMSAAVTALTQLGPRRLVVAVPVAPADTCARIAHEVDAMVCLCTPTPFVSVGQWYGVFPQVSDAEVTDCLRRHGPGDRARLAAFSGLH